MVGALEHETAVSAMVFCEVDGGAGMAYRSAVLPSEFGPVFLILLYVGAAVGFAVVTWRRWGNESLPDSLSTEDLPPPVPDFPKDEGNPFHPPNDLGQSAAVRSLSKMPQLGKIDLIGIALVWLMYSLGVLTPLLAKDTGAAPAEPVQQTAGGILAGAMILGSFALVPLALLSVRGSLREFFGFRFSGLKLGVLIGPVVTVLMFLVLALLNAVGYETMMRAIFGDLDVQEPVKMIKEANDPALIVALGFAAVISAPIMEELVFRGYLFKAMAHFTGVQWGAIFSSVIFALIHGNLMALLPLCLLGWVMAMAYHKTKSLWVPILIHACFNGAQFAVMMALKANPDLIPATP